MDFIIHMNLEDGPIFPNEASETENSAATLLSSLKTRSDDLIEERGYCVPTQFQSRIQFYVTTLTAQLRDVDLPFGQYREQQCLAALHLIQPGLDYLAYCHRVDQLPTESATPDSGIHRDAKWTFAQNIEKINAGFSCLERFQLPLRLPFMVVHNVLPDDWSGDNWNLYQ